ncbi:MAG: IPExxxVDY family protein [Chitinophagales bacterium]|nr:IPExxxVDY family protein [Chitinophagales bacterium]
MTKKRISFFEETFTGLLIALACQLKDYQLCWHLNKAFDFRLLKKDDLEIVHKRKSKTSFFSYYRYENEIDKWIIHVISNKHAGDFFTSEIKHADYLFFITGEVDSEQAKDFILKLKTIPSIQLISEIDLNKLKSKANFIFD